MQIELEAFYGSMAGALSPATVVFYQRRLKCLADYLGDIPLQDVTIDELRAWRRQLSERRVKYPGTARQQPGPLSPWTIHQHVRACRRFFSWCVEEGKIERSPARRLEKPQLPLKVRRGISPEAKDAIIAATECTRDKAMMLVLADTACRLAGLTGMQLEDVDLPRRRILVREKGRGGNHKERLVFLSERTARALAHWLVERGEAETSMVWLNRDGQGLTAGGIYQVIKRAAGRAGVARGWNTHNWRHGLIRWMLSKQVPLSSVSQIAGHSSTRVTGDIYGTFNDDELQVIHDRSTWIK